VFGGDPDSNGTHSTGSFDVLKVCRRRRKRSRIQLEPQDRAGSLYRATREVSAMRRIRPVTAEGEAWVVDPRRRLSLLVTALMD
jgi:hypothetical protein